MDRLGICAVIAVSVAVGLLAGLGISVIIGPNYPELEADLDRLQAELEAARQVAERAEAGSQVAVAGTPSPTKADARPHEQPHEGLSEQPEQSTESTSHARTGSMGKHLMEAEFVEAMDDDKARLRKTNGEFTSLPIERLSEVDREWIDKEMIGEGLALQPAINIEKARGPPADDEPTVYVTRTGKKYHRAGCLHLKKSKKPMPLSEAKRSYSPCSRCKPPQ